MKKLSYLVLFFLLAIPASAQNQFKLSSIPFLLSQHNCGRKDESFQQPFREVEGCERPAYPV